MGEEGRGHPNLPGFDPSPRAQDGRARRRVSALLNTYYHFETPGGEVNRQEPADTRDDNLDQQAFDAQGYFDGMIEQGQLPDLVQRTKALDEEVTELDGKMQMIVYENYSKFVRATHVIKQMKFTLEGLEPDLNSLSGRVQRITACQQAVDKGITPRVWEVENLLKQQRLSRKLQSLFELPGTLRKCLDAGAYGRAVEAYCNCAGFLRQYKHLKTFQNVLDEVDQQMGRIRNALEQRLNSPDLPVDEAVNSAWTLFDLNEDQSKVASEYLRGRSAMLQRSLQKCFEVNDNALNTLGITEKMDQDLMRPESIALLAACRQARESFVPSLCSAVEGFAKLREHAATIHKEAGGTMYESVITEFVSAQIGELCGQLSSLVDKKYPPTRVLVSCVHSVRDALRRLHAHMPQLLSEHFSRFLGSIATGAMKEIFADACTSLVTDLQGLHGECKRLQESKNSGLDDVLEEIGKTEKSIFMHVLLALTNCQPLVSLLGQDRAACQRLLRGIHARLITFFVAFVEACYIYIGGGSGSVGFGDSSEVDLSLPRATTDALEEIANLAWSGLFGLALVRIGRHFETKAIAKVWEIAKELFGGCGEASAELVPCATLFRETRCVAQAVIKHYTLMSGQRLAHFFRNSVQNRNWMTVREPREPRLVVEMVLKEVYAFDAQLGRILGDPRQVRSPDAKGARPSLRLERTALLLEVERSGAKKMPVFAPIPFNRNGTIVGILRIAFKALYEFMREETFAKFGLQQIQVDCAFLADVARSDFVEAEDANVLDSLLDEVIESAKLRCVEPVLMNAASVETLCDEKKRGFKFE